MFFSWPTSQSARKLWGAVCQNIKYHITKQISKFQSKYQDTVSAVVQQIQMRCLCNFTEINIQNYEFSCRSIENTVVFRAEIIYTSLQQARYRVENLVTLVSGWAQSGTSICWFNKACCGSYMSPLQCLFKKYRHCEEISNSTSLHMLL